MPPVEYTIARTGLAAPGLANLRLIVSLHLFKSFSTTIIWANVSGSIGLVSGGGDRIGSDLMNDNNPPPPQVCLGISFPQGATWGLFSRRCNLEYIALYPNFGRYIRTTLRFTKEEAEVRKQALPYVTARCIRTLDVISEVICVLMKKSRRIGKKALAFVSALYIHFWSVFRALKTPFGCFESFREFFVNQSRICGKGVDLALFLLIR